MHIQDSSVRFQNRAEAGRLLANRLESYTKHPDVIVAALPRGGIPVGAQIASELNVPMYVFVVRKLGVPGHQELAMGAISSGGRKWINPSITRPLHITESEIESEIKQELQEVARRERLYSRGRRRPDLRGKTVILTDDGVATGASILLAAEALRAEGAAYILMAIPVAPAETVSTLQKFADSVICLANPVSFNAVGNYYRDFHQLDDREVCLILDGFFERRHEAQIAFPAGSTHTSEPRSDQGKPLCAPDSSRT